MGNKIKLPRYTCVILLLPALCYCQDTSVICRDNQDMMVLYEGNITEFDKCFNGTELQCEIVNNQTTLLIVVKSSSLQTFNFIDSPNCASFSENSTRCYKCFLINSSTTPLDSTCGTKSPLVNESVRYLLIHDTRNACSNHSIVDKSSYTNSIFDQLSYSNSIVEQSYDSSSTADQSSDSSSTVDESSFASSIIDQSSFASSVFDQSPYTSSIVEQSPYTSAIVDQSSYTSALVDQSSYPSAIVEHSSYTSPIVEQSSYTSSIVVQSSFTIAIVDQSSYTIAILEQSSYTSAIVDQSSYTRFIIDTTYSPIESLSIYAATSTASTVCVLEGASLKSFNSTGLLSETFDSEISTGQDPRTSDVVSHTSLILPSATEISSNSIDQSEITEASHLPKISTLTTLLGSYDDSQTSLLSTESVFKSTPVLYDSFTTTSYSSFETTFVVQPSTMTEATFDSSSNIDLYSSLEFAPTISFATELYETSILKRESELATSSINGSFFLSLTQSLNKASDLSTSFYIQMTKNITPLISRSSELFAAQGSSVLGATVSEIISSKSQMNIDAANETSYRQATSSMRLSYQTLTTAMFEISNAFLSSDASVMSLYNVTATSLANVTGDATTGSQNWDNSTAPAIAASASAVQLVPIVVGIVLGAAAAVAFVVLLCLFVRHKKRTQLETRAQRYKTNGYRNWKESSEAKKKRKFPEGDEYVTLSELVSTGKLNDTFIRNSFDSFNGFDLPVQNFTSDRMQDQIGMSSCVNNPYAGVTLSSTPRQDKAMSKALIGGVDDRLDVGTIIAGLNNNIHHKNNNNTRKSNVLNLEDSKRINQECVEPHSEIALKRLNKADEMKHKAELRLASAMFSIYSEIKNGDVNKDRLTAQPSLSGVYTTIDEINAKRKVSLVDSLYAQVEETENPEKENYYSSVRKEGLDTNGTTFPSFSSLYAISRISDSSVSGISQRADSTRNSHLYEYVSYTCGNDLGEISDSRQSSLYSSSLAYDLREPLNHYNSPSDRKESTGPGESFSEQKHLKPQTKSPNLLISVNHEAEVGKSSVGSLVRENGSSPMGENIYFVLEKDGVNG